MYFITFLPPYRRSTILVEVYTQGTADLSYAPGDHVGVCPDNAIDLVDRVLVRLDTKMPLDTTMKCEFLEQKNTPLGKKENNTYMSLYIVHKGG